MPTCILNSDSIYEKSGKNFENIYTFIGFLWRVSFKDMALVLQLGSEKQYFA